MADPFQNTINYETNRSSYFPQHSRINDISIDDALLHKPSVSKNSSSWIGRVARKAKSRILGRKKSIEDYFEKEREMAEREMLKTRMQLIGDQIYLSSLPSPERSLQQLILKYTNVFSVILPETPQLIVWNIFMTIVLLYYILEVGLIGAYGKVVWEDQINAWWSYLFNCFSIMALLCDLVLSFNRGYYHQGILILDRDKIYKHYFGVRFLIDLFALLSLSLCFFSGVYALNFLKICFIFKLYNLNLIDKTFQRVIQFHRRLYTCYLIGRLTLLLFIISHYLGITFYAIDRYVYTTNYYGPHTPMICWIYNAIAYAQMVILLPWYFQYEYTMYFAIGTMTTIAYGDITPLNPIETCYIIFALIIFCIVFAYALNNIIEILFESKASETNYDRESVTMNTFMQEKLVSEKLQTKVKAYFEFIWSEEKYRDRAVQLEMIEKLPKQLRQNLLLAVYQRFFTELLLLGPRSSFPQELAASLVSKVTEFRCSPRQILFDKDTDIQLSAMFLVKGKVCFYTTSKCVIESIEYGSFGVIEFFTQEPRQLSCSALTDCVLYSLKSADFFDAVKDNQTFLESAVFIKDRLKRGRASDLLGQLCFMCQEGSHFCKQCPHSHYAPNKMRVALNESRHNRCPTTRKKKLKYTFKTDDGSKYSADYANYEVKPTRQNLTFQEKVIEELGISDNFKNLDEYARHTEILLKYVRSQILQNGDYEQGVDVDLKQEYQIYYPEFNLSNVLKSL